MLRIYYHLQYSSARRLVHQKGQRKLRPSNGDRLKRARGGIVTCVFFFFGVVSAAAAEEKDSHHGRRSKCASRFVKTSTPLYQPARAACLWYEQLLDMTALQDVSQTQKDAVQRAAVQQPQYLPTYLTLGKIGRYCNSSSSSSESATARAVGHQRPPFAPPPDLTLFIHHKIYPTNALQHTKPNHTLSQLSTTGSVHSTSESPPTPQISFPIPPSQQFRTATRFHGPFRPHSFHPTYLITKY